MTADELPEMWKRIYDNLVEWWLEGGAFDYGEAHERALRAVLAMMAAKEDCYVE